MQSRQLPLLEKNSTEYMEHNLEKNASIPFSEWNWAYKKSSEAS